MKYVFLRRFTERLKSFLISIRKKFWRQLKFLLRDPRHPSLHIKKYDEGRGIWQARVDRKIRFNFLIKDDTYILLNIKKHSE